MSTKHVFLPNQSEMDVDILVSVNNKKITWIITGGISLQK